jgi:glycosyltransferase involved in cell wall biosynthesis
VRRPRVLFVGHTRYDLPLPAPLAKKWDALTDVLEPRVIGAAGVRVCVEDPRFRLLCTRVPKRLHGGAYYVSLPAVLALEMRRFEPHAIVAESPYQGLCALAARPALGTGPRPRLIIEVHGDWRTAPRLYGGPSRRTYAPLSDRAASLALRRADGTRAVSRYTAELVERKTGRAPLAVFPTYTDIESFSLRPLRPFPKTPTALWIGVLERYKNADGLSQIWRNVAARVPHARLVVIGRGRLLPVVERLVCDFPERVELVPQLSPPDVARRLDESTVLILPSRSEGLPRVILEAFARGRPVVASAAGGVPDIVVSERNGLLVPVGEDEAFADAVVDVLNDGALAERLAAGARADAEPLLAWTPERFASAVRNLVERALASSGHFVPTASCPRTPSGP